jgi:putative two-component system response regulator
MLFRGRKAGIASSFANGQTSPLHDIGKVGIPDYVLLKPSGLSDEEFAVMKTHTLIGAQTLEAALNNFPQARFLRIARDIAVAHHERWDGGGYPYAMAGDAIPLAARIVAVADVYDALTSKRIYKSAFAHRLAREIIVAETGQQFDPVLVEAFQEREVEFMEIHDRFAGERAGTLELIAAT